MLKSNITHTVEEGDIVTSAYAETYFNDDHCDTKKQEDKFEPIETPASEENEWISPSDLLIGKIELTPPFTSKITRGKTHQGILAIGDDILVKERQKFINSTNKLLRDNDAAWKNILEYEKKAVAKKVRQTYRDIFQSKSKILMQEINLFYEQTLQELENHWKEEINNIIITAQANIISDLNEEIKNKLRHEKDILETELERNYNSEVKKITHYYELLLQNEIYKNNKLLSQAIHERNDALKAFYTQIDTQSTTSTMYVMCSERKKCKIRQFLMENYQTKDMAEKHKQIQERKQLLEDYKRHDRRISDVNSEWEEKIKKVLKLFLKFISFGLKLLPEQSTFLFDLEKMVILQLNEIQKAPETKSSILIDIDDTNLFQFEKMASETTVCDKEPFLVVGDLSDPIPRQFGSRETIPPEYELPYVRLQRHLIYAKCQKIEEVKALLEAQRCKCHDGPPKASKSPTPSSSVPESVSEESIESESSLEHMLLDDIKILKTCPARNCQDWFNKNSFPFMPSYLDYTQQNYDNVKAVLEKSPNDVIIPEFIDASAITARELSFAATKEPFHNVETQYSSQEDISSPDFTCACTENVSKYSPSPEPNVTRSPSTEIDEIMLKRKLSLQKTLHDHPNLLKIFTDEDFDFVYTIK